MSKEQTSKESPRIEHHDRDVSSEESQGLTQAESLEDKLTLIKGMMNAGLGGPGSVKAGAVLPSLPKLQKPGGNNSLTPSTGISVPSKKNPVKQAQQTQNKDIKDLKMKEAQAALNMKKQEDEMDKAERESNSDRLKRIMAEKKKRDAQKKSGDDGTADKLKSIMGKKHKKDSTIRRALRKKPGEAKGQTAEERKQKENQAKLETKMKDPEYKKKALIHQEKENQKKKEQDRVYNEAVNTFDPDHRPPVAQKKRKSTYIDQFNRRKEAPDKKLIDKENRGEIKVEPKMKKSREEELFDTLTVLREELAKAKKKISNREKERRVVQMLGDKDPSGKGVGTVKDMGNKRHTIEDTPPTSRKKYNATAKKLDSKAKKYGHRAGSVYEGDDIKLGAVKAKTRNEAGEKGVEVVKYDNNGQWSLDKAKVNEPDKSSIYTDPSISPTGGKYKKWQGSDPRKSSDAEKVGGKYKERTTGTSHKRSDMELHEENEKKAQTGSKPQGPAKKYLKKTAAEEMLEYLEKGAAPKQKESHVEYPYAKTPEERKKVDDDYKKMYSDIRAKDKRKNIKAVEEKSKKKELEPTKIKKENKGWSPRTKSPEGKTKIKKTLELLLEELKKSGYKGYTEEDNARRKSKNLGEGTGIRTMDRIKRYGGSGPSAAAKEAKEMKRKSKKNPVKEYTPEEIATYEKEKGMKKKEGRCWDGYEPTPGKKAYEKGSCQPTKKADVEVAPEGSKNRKTYLKEFEGKKLSKARQEMAEYLEKAHSPAKGPMLPDSKPKSGESGGMPLFDDAPIRARKFKSGESQHRGGDKVKRIAETGHSKLGYEQRHIKDTKRKSDKKKSKLAAQREINRSREGQEKVNSKKKLSKSRQDIVEYLEKAKKKKKWTPKAKHKSDKGGLTAAGRKSYNKATGGNLKAPQPEGGPRKKSFCARNKGQIDKHNIDCKKDPDKRACKARRRWKC